MSEPCPQCAIKHLSMALAFLPTKPERVDPISYFLIRAIINLNESITGYPEHLYHAIGFLAELETRLTAAFEGQHPLGFDYADKVRDNRMLLIEDYCMSALVLYRLIEILDDFAFGYDSVYRSSYAAAQIDEAISDFPDAGGLLGVHGEMMELAPAIRLPERDAIVRALQNLSLDYYPKVEKGGDTDGV